MSHEEWGESNTRTREILVKFNHYSVNLRPKIFLFHFLFSPITTLTFSRFISYQSSSGSGKLFSPLRSLYWRLRFRNVEINLMWFVTVSWEMLLGRWEAITLTLAEFRLCSNTENKEEGDTPYIWIYTSLNWDWQIPILLILLFHVVFQSFCFVETEQGESIDVSGIRMWLIARSFIVYES